MLDLGPTVGGRGTRAGRTFWVLAFSVLCLFATGCKKSKAELDAEESRKIIESKAELRKRLHQQKLDRAEREAWLKAHPELLEFDGPDEAHRPTEPVPSNLPPQLLGAPPPVDNR
jgi:hypothetical protein